MKKHVFCAFAIVLLLLWLSSCGQERIDYENYYTATFTDLSELEAICSVDNGENGKQTISLVSNFVVGDLASNGTWYGIFQYDVYVPDIYLETTYRPEPDYKSGYVFYDENTGEDTYVDLHHHPYVIVTYNPENGFQKIHLRHEAKIREGSDITVNALFSYKLNSIYPLPDGSFFVVSDNYLPGLAFDESVTALVPDSVINADRVGEISSASQYSEARGNQYLLRFDKTGKLVSSKLVMDIVEDRVNVNMGYAFIPDDNGTVFFLSDILYGKNFTVIYAADVSGKLLYTVKLSETVPEFVSGNYQTPQLIKDSDGTVYLYFTSIDGDKILYDINELHQNGKNAVPKLATCKERAVGTLHLCEGVPYFSDSFGINRVADDGSLTRIALWSDLGCSRDMISGNVTMLSEQDIRLIPYDVRRLQSFFVHAEKQPEPINANRKQIVIALEDNSSAVNLNRDEIFYSISRFNRENENYYIYPLCYTTDEDSTANEKLRRDIMGGIVPDIIVFGGTITSRDFEELDVLRDMYDFIDEDEVYNREAFLPCVLEPFEDADGELPYIVTCFTFDTLIGKASILGEDDSIGIDKFAELVSSMPEDKYLMKVDESESPSLELFELILPAVVDEYLDYENAACDFDDDFKKLLEACKNANLRSLDGKLKQEYYADDIIMLEHLSIATLPELISERFSTIGLDDIAYVGAPRSGTSDCGTVIVSETCMGITKKAEYAEGAWEFIKSSFADQTDLWKIIRDVHISTAMKFVTGFPPTWETADILLEVAEDFMLYFKTYSEKLSNGEDGIRPRMFYYYKSDGVEPKRNTSTPSSGSYTITVNPDGTTTSTYVDTRTPEEIAKDAEASALQRDLNLRYSKYRSYTNMGCLPITFSPEDLEFLKGLFIGCKHAASTDNAVMAIVLEEASAYFAGANSLDDTVRYINNRVGTRMLE